MGRAPAVAALILSAGCAGGPAPTMPPGDYTPRPEEPDLEVTAELRDAALARAEVWRPPPVAVGKADLLNSEQGPGWFPASADVTCRFALRPSAGLTPKFQCVLPGGEVVKVKYGRSNGETRAEVAASRLLRSLGFGADHVYVVRRVRCFGCPYYPYPRFSWLDAVFADYDRAVDFDFAIIERPLEGRAVETPEREGWAWYELDAIDPSLGPEARAQRDALRLLAVFLHHWDNKADNQRLVCRDEPPPSDGRCRSSFAFISDLGSCFGPWKADLAGWRSRAVWADAATCRVSMKDLPFGGATFTDRQIGESGRRLLAGLLGQLTARQIRDLFGGARFSDPLKGRPGEGDIDGWVAAFQDRVRQIVDRPPCPLP